MVSITCSSTVCRHPISFGYFIFPHGVLLKFTHETNVLLLKTCKLEGQDEIQFHVEDPSTCWDTLLEIPILLTC